MSDDVRGELRQQRELIERLEARVAALEAAALVSSRAAPSAVPGGPSSGPTSELSAGTQPAASRHTQAADWFTRVAVVCFALVGALVLRTATRSGVLQPLFGTSLGLAYCAALLSTSLFQRRWPALRRHSTTLQFSGVILANLIVLESFHRGSLFTATEATGLLFAVSVAGSLAGISRGLRALTGVSLAAGIIAVAAIGWSLDALPLRGLAAAADVGIGLAVTHKRRWIGLRPVLLLPAGIVFTPAILATARRPHEAAIVPLAIIGEACLVWLMVAASHFARARELSAYEALWLPLVSVGLLGASLFYSPAGAATLAVALAAAGFVWAGLYHHRRPEGRAAVTSVVVAASLITALATPAAHLGGLGLSVLAVVAIAFAIQLDALVVAACSYLIAVAAVAFALVALQAGPTGAPSIVVLTETLATGVVLVIHYALSVRRGGGRLGDGFGRWLEPIALLGGLLTLYVALRAVGIRVLGQSDAFQLAQTVVLALMSLVTFRIAHRRGLRDLRWVGFGIMALLAGKVVFRDLPRLEGVWLLGSVVTLGLVSLVVSMSLGRSHHSSAG